MHASAASSSTAWAVTTPASGTISADSRSVSPLREQEHAAWTTGASARSTIPAGTTMTDRIGGSVTFSQARSSTGATMRTCGGSTTTRASAFAGGAGEGALARPAQPTRESSKNARERRMASRHARGREVPSGSAPTQKTSGARTIRNSSTPCDARGGMTCRSRRRPCQRRGSVCQRRGSVCQRRVEACKSAIDGDADARRALHAASWNGRPAWAMGLGRGKCARSRSSDAADRSRDHRCSVDMVFGAIGMPSAQHRAQ
jgi:hypothetical protein